MEITAVPHWDVLKKFITEHIYCLESGSFLGVSKLLLIWCIFVLCCLVTMVCRCGTVDRCLIDPSGFCPHNRLALPAEHVLSHCLSVWLCCTV